MCVGVVGALNSVFASTGIRTILIKFSFVIALLVLVRIFLDKLTLLIITILPRIKDLLRVFRECGTFFQVSTQCKTWKKKFIERQNQQRPIINNNQPLPKYYL